MANGKCSRCEIVLTEENSPPSILKSRGGLCRECAKEKYKGTLDINNPAKLRKKQTSGQQWTFISKRTGEKDTGILPAVFGETNDFAEWKKTRWGGSWYSRHFNAQMTKLQQRGEGSKGLISRMSHLLVSARGAAKKGRYKHPIIEPKELLYMWQMQSNKCAACLGPFKDIFAARLDHNHETGEVRGFIHDHCNIVEGRTLKMSDKEFKNLIDFINKIRGQRNNSTIIS